MKRLGILAILGCVANAAYFIMDTNVMSDGITYTSTLRYSDKIGMMSECTDDGSQILIQQGQLGGYAVCDNLYTSIGLYFPDGYDGSSITQVYDYYSDVFYSCTEIDNNDDFVTYICPNIDVITKDTPATISTIPATVRTIPTTTIPTTVRTIPTTTIPATVRTIPTTTNSPRPTCKNGVFGKRNGRGKSGQCCRTSNDCRETCKSGVCGTCDKDFIC